MVSHETLCTIGTGFFLGYSGRGVKLTPQPLLVPWSKKSRAIPQTVPGAHPASCKMVTASFPGLKSDGA